MSDAKTHPTRDRLLSKREAAGVLGGVCVRTVDALIRQKKLRAVRIGRRVLVPDSSCQRFIAGRG